MALPIDTCELDLIEEPVHQRGRRVERTSCGPNRSGKHARIGGAQEVGYL